MGIVQNRNRLEYFEDVVHVHTTKGFFIIDLEDVPLLENRSWYMSGNKCKYPAAGLCKVVPGHGKYGRKYSILYLHRHLMSTPKNLECDHINGNTFDCRKVNLRNCTKKENCLNKKKTTKEATSIYKGVIKYRDGRWDANISTNGKARFLGRFESEKAAARAYDIASIKYHGEFGSLNFPRSDYE